MSVETVVEEVKQEVASVEVKSEQVAEKIVEEVKTAAQAVRVEITDAEKLAVRNLENEFLKTQMQIQQLNTNVQNAQRQFTSLVEGFVKKYAIDDTAYIFDAVELAFKKK